MLQVGHGRLDSESEASLQVVEGPESILLSAHNSKLFPFSHPHRGVTKILASVVYEVSCSVTKFIGAGVPLGGVSGDFQCSNHLLI